MSTAERFAAIAADNGAAALKLKARVAELEAKVALYPELVEALEAVAESWDGIIPGRDAVDKVVAVLAKVKP